MTGRDGAAPEKRAFGRADGRDVELYTLKNARGVVVRIMTWGATVVSLEVPDRHGRLGDVVLGFDSLADYVKGSPYFGAVVGRYANRIGKGRFSLHGVEHRLAQNNGPNHLHGGLRGFDKRMWTAEPMGQASLRLFYLSADGEEGYPGSVKVAVTYTLTDENELRVEYAAMTDRDTVLNLSNHSYFNLAGEGATDVLGHELTIAASGFLPVDRELIPTGEIRSVEGTPMDFTHPTPIGARIGEPDPQLTIAGGYDHNWVLGPGGTLALAARAFEPTSGRVMEVFTTEPGMQFYSGNFLDGTLTGKSGSAYRHRAGFCLETQHFPDSPNHPTFPSTVLAPNLPFASTTVFRFSAR